MHPAVIAQAAASSAVPDSPPPIYVSGFGPKSAELAGRIGDGYITTAPDTELIGVPESQSP